MAISLTDLYIYPVKSLHGLRLAHAQLDIKGLADDRRWMIIDENNRFVTQRTLPKLATLRTRLSEHRLVITASTGECEIARHYEGCGSPFSARIWNDEVQVLDEGASVSRWLTEALAHPRPLRLVRLSNTPRPQSKPQYLGQAHTVFADMAPLLIANQASLDALNQALIQKGEQPVPMNRFRPNIVINGLPAFAEHRLATLSGPHFELTLAYPCERCVMTTVDQTHGTRHPAMEPYRTLTGLNAMPAYGEGDFHKAPNPKTPAFGENAYLTGTHTTSLNVGETLRASYKK
ncbi:MOSC N-terminal beta barrel domain-containing protein [Simiduia sp. 21SJ11W-1]|uniref:MOSC domain-containing protein n=1 Tax=Simiduia sp. 21SJ11W-1 TaxID=2909669 RepID=UPI00209D18F8|nr:MOSC N-terminal beta barrel domain-containing protein [Simiduia sp. 21SJ11W-1]UTA48918.1 MOSC N-terminal beta barrel domain-containing protein [Simiduia sp. 21SJ11W-1]